MTQARCEARWGTKTTPLLLSAGTRSAVSINHRKWLPPEPPPLAPSPRVQASWQSLGRPWALDKLRGWAPSQSEGFKQHPARPGAQWLRVDLWPGSWAAAVLPAGCVLPGRRCRAPLLSSLAVPIVPLVNVFVRLLSMAYIWSSYGWERRLRSHHADEASATHTWEGFLRPAACLFF